MLMEPTESTMSEEMRICLNRVVTRMLAKDQKSRYADGRELLAELKGVSSPGPGSSPTGTGAFPSQSRKPSIAVLPFANLRSDPENEYCCDGLAEELIAELAKLEGLQDPAWTQEY